VRRTRRRWTGGTVVQVAADGLTFRSPGGGGHCDFPGYVPTTSGPRTAITRRIGQWGRGGGADVPGASSIGGAEAQDKAFPFKPRSSGVCACEGRRFARPLASSTRFQHGLALDGLSV